ncbi:MAG: cytochrome c [Acidobacteria bacterium]|nr:MAG: cytochrome c [Acidobacteriota bacterium]RLE30864.1 MAG: cytochrome c [Acidobacteriota bacterium]
MNGLPRWIIYSIVVLVTVSWIPLALALRARTVRSAKPPLHVVTDMDNQPSYRTQKRNMMFADRRAMRPQVSGTVARGQLISSDALAFGKEGDDWVTAFPLPVDQVLLERGRERFSIYCSPCHGHSGYGDGAVAKRADTLQEGTWTPPSSFHTDLIRSRPVGHIYNSITHGIRNMPAYGPQISVEDRWAVVAYVKALQRSQFAGVDDVPSDLRASLR